MKAKKWKDEVLELEWKGDSLILLDREFRQECTRIFVEAGMDTLTWYLFIAEKAGSNIAFGTPPDRFISKEDEQYFESDLQSQDRLKRVAAFVLGSF